MHAPPRTRIARRVKALREARNLTQDELAARTGLKHRQIIASIEAGERAVQPVELVGIARALDVELDHLTDPFRLVGEGRFSFRADDVPTEAVDRFEEQAGRWVATFRTLQEEAGVPPRRLGHKLELTVSSSFEEAQDAAEQIRRAWNLGDVPAETLRDAIERELGVQVLFIDAPRGLSGAAVQLPGLHAILVNRSEVEGRRNFDTAHELFHVLTWDAMEPNRVEPSQPPPLKGNRVERLADNFAGALLMPESAVRERWSSRSKDDDLAAWLNVTATALRVTSDALRWRLVSLGLTSKAAAQGVPPAWLVNNGGLVRDVPPLPFNRAFVGRVYHAVEEGRLSLRRAVDLVGTSGIEFAELCRAYNLELSYEI